ncbi:MAG: autotransporter-associated beta strand repeat-containing protein, partial [Verrucomicrobia bacterium]|nr:autotransporter-associated beta strand repeat-containing protein [Verrucomicrobiota bacterium]
VDLSVSGLPSGATAAFSPSSVTGSGSSTLDVLTSVSTPAGSYTLTVTGTDTSDSALKQTNTVTLIVNTGAGFSISVSPDSQTVSGGGSTNYTVTVSTNSAFSGSVTFGASGLPPDTIFQFSPPSLSGSGTSIFSVTTSNSAPGGIYPLTISGMNVAGTNIASATLIVGRTGGATLIWNSTGSSLWDVTNSANWLNVGANARDQFYNGDNVTFNDTASVTAIAIPAGVAALPSAITNNSDANNFSISGSGKISGSTALVKEGTSTLTLGTINDFTGGVIVLNGILRPTCTNAVGATGGNVTVQNGGTLDLNGVNLAGQLITVSGTGFTNGGAIINDGSQQTVAFHNVTLAGDSTFGGTGRWDIRGSGGAASLNTTPAGSAFNITKVGTNQVSLVGVTTIDSAIANIDIQQGTFALQTSTAQVGAPSGTITVHGGATLDFYNLTTPLNKNIVIEDGGMVYNEKGPSYIGGGATLTLQGNAIFNVVSNGSPPSLNCSNAISGPGALILTNNGALTLAAPNDYTGSTLVESGTLALTGLGSVSGSAFINVLAGATLDASGRVDNTLTMESGQTLAGAGTVQGNLQVNQGATLLPGGSGAGVLTIQGQTAGLNGRVSITLNASAATNNALSAQGAIDYGGTLALTNAGGALTATDTFKLFNAVSYNGAFTNITPAIPALNLAWDTSTLDTDGTLRIAAAPTPAPEFTGLAANGSNLIMSGSNGVPDWPYVVLISTNISRPFGQWTPIVTNTFDGKGDFVFTNWSSGGNPVFYLLKLQ